jgi:integrase
VRSGRSKDICASGNATANAAAASPSAGVDEVGWCSRDRLIHSVATIENPTTRVRGEHRRSQPSEGPMAGGVYRYETKAGPRWRIVYDGPPSLDPATGNVERKQKQRRGFEREKDARRALRDLHGTIDDGSYVDADEITLARYLTDEWLPSIKPRRADSGRRHRGTVSVATHDRYAKDLRRYVMPRLGAVRLQALAPAHLDQLYDTLESAGGSGGQPLSPTTVANVAGTLHKALADAVKRGRLRRNPADAVSPPTRSKAPARWWSIEELRAFLHHVEDDDLRAAWLLFATTGARAGEVAGLTWSDLDLDGGWLRVEWTLGAVGHELTWKVRPKSRAGERVMALDPATVAALREHRRRQHQARLLLGPGWPEGFTDWQGLSRTGLVWTHADGRPVHPKTFYKRFRRLATEAGLPPIRLHDVRHSYASAALASADGWHEVKVISQRLGHASVAITLDTYSHVLPAADVSVAHTLARLILGGD